MGLMFSKQVVTDPGCEQWVHTSYCCPNKETITDFVWSVQIVTNWW